MKTSGKINEGEVLEIKTHTGYFVDFNHEGEKIQILVEHIEPDKVSEVTFLTPKIQTNVSEEEVSSIATKCIIAVKKKVYGPGDQIGVKFKVYYS